MTNDAMSIEAYLAEGGALTAPQGVPPRYRAELLRLMASFVDSELAGSAGFAEVVNDAPGVKARIAAARIVLEKTDHADRVLQVMEPFGVDVQRYAVHHPWAARLARDADLSQARQGSDMRLSVFHYPLEGWVDAVAMNALMGLATVVQLRELGETSYRPLAETFREIAPRETRHAELGLEGLAEIVGRGERATAQAALDYWCPRVAASFGVADSARFDLLNRFGLRHRPNEALREEWAALSAERLAPLDLN